MVNQSAVAQAVKMIGREHALIVVKLAQEQDRMEHKWLSRADKLRHEITKQIIDGLKANGKASIDDDLIIEFFFEHYLAVTRSAIRSAEAEMHVIDKRVKMAKIRIPRSLSQIRKAYDLWRRTGRVPKPFQSLGDKIRNEYLKKTQHVWKNYSDDYRQGTVADQENVLRKVEKAAETATARAQTIVRTETTNYYNNTRREIYDQSDAVTHYLFLAIRDQRTTRWCSDRVIDGKRGRHGLVYAKGDPITDAETPACHWNCRSEMVPLSPFNPRHRKLIEDMNLHRRNNKCHALPEGWSNVS